MPVHCIPTSFGDTLHWYESSQCVAYRNRLYFMINVGIHTCHTLLTAADTKQLSTGDVIFNEPADAWRYGKWPVPDFSIVFQLLSADVTVPDYRTCCFFMCERVTYPVQTTTYVDQINPAFKRLQRWFRGCLWKKRKGQRLQFALATRNWLQDDMVKAIGLLIK